MGFIGIDKNSGRLEAVNGVSGAKGELIPPGASGTKPSKDSSSSRIQLDDPGDGSLKPGLEKEKLE